MTPFPRLLFLLLILFVKNVRNQELTAEILNVKLPESMRGTETVYDGKEAFYIIGGQNPSGLIKSEIYKYSLLDGRLTQEGLLPSPRFAGKAVIDNDNENIYYFGGLETSSISEIFRFNLATKTTTLVGNLTKSTYGHGAILYKDAQRWDETSKVFLIGGYTTPQLIQCWDIDLQSNCPTPTQTIDTEFKHAAAVSYGNQAFVFGDANDTTEGDPIYRVNLDTFQTSFGERTLPNLEYTKAAVIAGSNAYIIGGWKNQTNSIIQIDLDTLEQTVLTVKNFFPNEQYIEAISAVYVEKFNRIYVVGGGSSSFAYLDEIWSIDLSPIYVPPTTAEPSTFSPPTSSTMDPSLFTCDDKPDGFYPSPYDCAQYIGCHYNNGTIRYYTCPKPLLYNPAKKTCDSPNNVNCEITCVDKPDGLYAHPQDCSYFILCEDSDLDVYKCPDPLLFDPIEGMCNLPEIVDCLVYI